MSPLLENAQPPRHEERYVGYQQQHIRHDGLSNSLPAPFPATRSAQYDSLGLRMDDEMSMNGLFGVGSGVGVSDALFDGPFSRGYSTGTLSSVINPRDMPWPLPPPGPFAAPPFRPRVTIDPYASQYQQQQQHQPSGYPGPYSRNMHNAGAVSEYPTQYSQMDRRYSVSSEDGRYVSSAHGSRGFPPPPQNRRRSSPGLRPGHRYAMGMDTQLSPAGYSPLLPPVPSSGQYQAGYPMQDMDQVTGLGAFHF